MLSQMLWFTSCGFSLSEIMYTIPGLSFPAYAVPVEGFAAMPYTCVPAGMVSDTVFVLLSIIDTVPSPEFATYTLSWLESTDTPSGFGPTVILDDMVLVFPSMTNTCAVLELET